MPLLSSFRDSSEAQNLAGPVLCTRKGEGIQHKHNMTVFLLRSANKYIYFAPELFKNQNEGINISVY